MKKEAEPPAGTVLGPVIVIPGPATMVTVNTLAQSSFGSFRKALEGRYKPQWREPSGSSRDVCARRSSISTELSGHSEPTSPLKWKSRRKAGSDCLCYFKRRGRTDYAPDGASSVRDSRRNPRSTVSQESFLQDRLAGTRLEVLLQLPCLLLR